MVRIKLSEIPEVNYLNFELDKRQLIVYHTGNLEGVKKAIKELQLKDVLTSSVIVDKIEFSNEESQRKVLWIVLIINAVFFFVEFLMGFISSSMGLVADSLDMLADSVVYGMSLLAVGGSVVRKKRIAWLAGYFQIILAVIGFVEVLRRFIFSEELPDFKTMIFVALVVLLANVICLILLKKSKQTDEAHIKASMIFTSNDIIINLGVVLTGFLVHWLDSNKPDLIIGFIVFVIVLIGAKRILKFSN